MSVKKVADGLKSMYSNLGRSGSDKTEGLYFGYIEQPAQMNSDAYKDSWLARKIVNVPVEDAVREWREWSGGDNGNAAVKEKELGLARAIKKCSILARTYGENHILIISNQEDLEQPLSENQTITGLSVLAPLDISACEREDSILHPDFGEATLYECHLQSGAHVRIHKSHLITLKGIELVDLQSNVISTQSNLAGQSVIDANKEAIAQAESAAKNINALIHEAKIDVIGVPELMANMGSPDAQEYESVLLKRFSLSSISKSISGLFIHDKEETYDRKSSNFANLDALLKIFTMNVGASESIPESRFLGTETSGLKTSGNSLALYHERVRALQADYAHALSLFDKMVSGGETFAWKPLYAPSQKEQADIEKVIIDGANTLSMMQIYEENQLREITEKRLSQTSGYKSIGDKDVS